MRFSTFLPVLAVASAVSASPVVEARANKAGTTSLKKYSSSSGKAPTSPMAKPTTHASSSTLVLPTATPTGSQPDATVPGFASGPATKTPTHTVGTKFSTASNSMANHAVTIKSAMTVLSQADAKAYTANFISTASTAAKKTSSASPAVKVATTSSKKISTTTSPKKTSTTTTKKASTTTTKKAATTTSAKHARRQVIKAVSSSTTTTTTTTSLQAGCQTAEPIPYTYLGVNMTIPGFWADATYSAMALANVIPPAGYQTIFTNGLAAITDNSYLTMTQALSTYNTTQCAVQCNNMAGCVAFNIYFQRNAQYTPNTNCINPPARTAIQCGFYSNYVNSSSLTNLGVWEQQFGVVLAGSNVYWRITPPAAVPGFHGPTAQSGAMGVTSSDYVSYGYMTTYSPQTCATACQSLTSSRRQISTSWYFFTGGAYTPCNSFNVFNITLSGVTQSYVCVMYSDMTANVGTPSTSIALGGVTYNTTYSYTYDLYPLDQGSIYKTYTSAPQGTSATCSSLAASSSTLTDYDGVTWNLACGYDVSGLDVTAVWGVATDFYSCFDICNKQSGCDAFSWVSYTPYGVCYLKNVQNAVIAPVLSKNGNSTDFAWMSSATYAGFSARNATTATIAAVTVTSAWASAATTTLTRIAGTTGSVVVYTSGTIKPASTVGTITYYTTSTESGTATAVTTTTISGANSKTSTVMTVYPTPGLCNGVSLQGANYAFYTNNFMGGQNTYGYPSFSPESYKLTKPNKNGTSTYIAEDNDGVNLQTIYGNANVDGTSLVIQNTFYLYAGRGTGYYTFQIPYADDIEMVWIGNKAVSGWARSNNDLLQFWSGSTQVPVILGYSMTQGSYLPIRVQWGNGGGPGSLQLSIWAPDGSFILQGLGTGSNSAIMSGSIITRPCNATLGAPFPAWGAET